MMLLLLSITALILLFLSFSSCADKEIIKHPNILVIFTDDQTYKAIGYNNPEVKTPVLDQLASEGMIFTHAYTATPICAASRASLMTGLYPQKNGTVALDYTTFQEKYCEDSGMTTLPRLFNAAGYETCLVGKSHLGNPREYGFQIGEVTNDYRDSAHFQFATGYIRNIKKENKPFFLWLAPLQPHVPLYPGEQWLNLYDTSKISISKNFRESPERKSIYNQGIPGEHFYRDSDYTQNWKELPAGPPRSVSVIKDFTKAYYATISHLDRQIGDLVEVLKEEGLYDNTIIIFLSDNGYFLGNHGLGNKITMHEESVRVPMFIHWQGLQKKGSTCNELVSSLDVFPTVLELAGIPYTGNTDGLSLVPLLQDTEGSIREFVASEIVGVGGKLGEGHRMVRTSQWKYVITDMNEEALFNELTDPSEMDNVIDNYPEKADEMRKYMIRWMQEVGDTHQRPRINN
ncbi:MAG: sulfatase-like hydrolase/transferase [Bacteroidales bacterium]|nr:sulfatase-like hydrolase/transferase [Bacteroidales bacterium]